MNEYDFDTHRGYDPDFDVPYSEPFSNEPSRQTRRGMNQAPRQTEPQPLGEERIPRRRVRANEKAANAEVESESLPQQRSAPTRKVTARENSKMSAKRQEEKSPRKKFSEWGIVKFFRDHRFHAFMGVALVFVAVYIAVAAISFVRSGSRDQSLLARQTVEQLVSNGQTVENSAGPFGAMLAQSLIVEGLGLGAIALVAYLVLLGLSLIGARRRSFWSLTFKSLLVAIAISLVMGLLSLWLSTDFDYGGYHGKYINTLLIAHIDWIGALLVNALLLVAVFFVYINDLVAIYKRWSERRRVKREHEEALQLQKDEARERVRRAMNDSQADFNPEEKSTGGIEPGVDITGTEHSEEPITVGFVSEEHPMEDFDAAQVLEKLNDAEEVAENSPENHEIGKQNSAEPTLSVEQNTIEEADRIETDTYDPTAELSHFKLPPLDILRDIPQKEHNSDIEEQEENKQRIISTLGNYGIGISKIKATVGPTVTLYEIVPKEGVRIATIKRLEDDIAMSLSALATRIIAPIPGKGTIGIEVPNKDPQIVSIRSILGSKKYQECKYELPMAMGATIQNEVFIADLAKMPHLLVAGATGMGKSVGLNTIIASLIYKKHPAELKFVLIDPKTVEFSLYNILENHYLAKLPDQENAVVTSMKNVQDTLNSLVVEMENRYALLREANVRSLKEYNEKFVNKKIMPVNGHRYLPYIVVIIDEFCDLIITAGKEVEKPIVRFAQMARAVGMHMIIATQRPSTNVITGIIKANFPGRIAFRVGAMVDSKTILDKTGANNLIGKGDMLFSSNGVMERVQCAYIDTAEVEAICEHIDGQAGYPHAYILPEPKYEGDENEGRPVQSGERDPLFEEIAEYVVGSGVASTSALQRRYNIGFNRAGRIMDQLEAVGIVGPAQGGKARELRVDPLGLNSILSSLKN